MIKLKMHSAIFTGYKKIIFFTITFLLVNNLANAAIITLKSGKQVEGKILEETDQYIKIEVSGQPLYYRLNLIANREDGGYQPEAEDPTFKDPEFYLKEGLQYASGENFKQAEESLKKGLDIYKADHNLKEVLKIIEDLKNGKISKEYAMILLKGSDFLINKEFEKAVNEFRKGIALEPEDADLYYYLGISNFCLDNYQEAIDYLTKAQRTKDNLDQVYFYSGISYYAIGEIHTAIEYMEKALKINPEDAHSHGIIGTCYFALGQLQQARQHLEKAKELFQEKGDYLNSRDIEELLKKISS